MSLADALGEIERSSGGQFHPAIATAFLRVPPERLSAVRAAAGPLPQFAEGGD